MAIIYTVGQVASVNIIKDRHSGRSRGFAFVEMPSKSEAQAAIEGLKGETLKDRTIDVSEARPRSDSRSGGSLSITSTTREFFFQLADNPIQSAHNLINFILSDNQGGLQLKGVTNRSP